jgi:catechol 2,3-dioxygenase-like lactoylglutathione lyase family enzyme
MSVELNHTIVNVRDKREAANFLTEILGLPPPEPFSHFLVVHTSNGVSLDFTDSADAIDPQHYAFLVSEAEFDPIFARIQARQIPYWADPARQLPNQINHRHGGRGVYFEDPSGHFLEVITQPYATSYRKNNIP